jgi:hypothetical protein
MKNLSFLNAIEGRKIGTQMKVEPFNSTGTVLLEKINDGKISGFINHPLIFEIHI